MTRRGRPASSARVAAFLLGSLLLGGGQALAQEQAPASSSSQDSTADRAGTEGSKAAGPPQPADQSLRERLVAWAKAQRVRLDSSNQPREPRKGFFPRGGVVTPGSGLAAGAGYRNERLNGWPIGFDASAIFSVRGYELYQLMVGLIEHRRGGMSIAPGDAKPSNWFREAGSGTPGFSLYADLVYRDFPRQPYYGLGPAAHRWDRADFLQYGASYDAVAQYQLSERFGVTSRVGLLDVGVAAGRDPNRPNLEAAVAPDVARQLMQPARFFVVAVGGALDTRSSRNDPHDGVFAGATISRYDNLASGVPGFTRVVVDTRTYLTPLQPHAALALRLLVATDIAARGAAVPFYLQHNLGGAETLRGFSSYRFRDRTIAHATAEYRWLVHDYVDVGPFVDVGVVGPSLAKLSTRNVVATFGLRAGARYRSRVLFHLDAGRSREGFKVTGGTGVLF